MNKPLYSVSITEAYDILRELTISAINSGRVPRNTFIHGSMGLGKSTIIQDTVEDIKSKTKYKKVVLIDLRLSAFDDPASLMGIPFLPTEKKDDQTEMYFSTPSWFPDNNPDVFYILFLDELPNAHPSIQQAAYRLVLDRSINNGKKLGDNVWIVAAGNLKSDNTGARDVLPALANRFSVHLQIDKDRCVDDFIRYAYAKNLDMRIISFISYKRDALNVSYANEPAFATSRTWEMLHENLVDGANLPTELKTAMIAGTVGSAIGSEFMAFMEFESILPKWDDVRAGMTYTLPTGIAERYYVMTALSREVVVAMDDQDSEYVGHLSAIISNLEIDHRVVLFKLIKSIGLGYLLKVLSYPELMKLYQPIASRVK
jgi:MoxR-like ATPase